MGRGATLTTVRQPGKRNDRNLAVDRAIYHHCSACPEVKLPDRVLKGPRYAALRLLVGPCGGRSRTFEPACRPLSHAREALNPRCQSPRTASRVSECGRP